jgi:hypothetical protein
MTIISLFLPSTIRITKTEEINATKEKVMEQISDPSKWKKWYPGLDSAELFYEGGIATGVIQNEKKKQMIMIKGKNGDEVMTEYKIAGKTKITGGWQLSSEQGSVMVQWYMTVHLHWYPWEKFAGILYERSLGTQIKTGLIRLKDLLETK